MVVFDFDKTLTNKDTLWGFYKEADGSCPIFILKRGALLLFAVLYKAKVISNTQLKQLGVFLFLKGKSRAYLEDKAASYANKILLNDIYSKYFLSTPKNKRLITSASLELYLKALFPEEEVIGTSLLFAHGKAVALKNNMYGEQKKRALLQRGVSKIERLYTDSCSDKPLMRLAEEISIVKNSKIISIAYNE